MIYVNDKPVSMIPTAMHTTHSLGLNLQPEEAQVYPPANNYTNVRDALGRLGIKATYRAIQSDNFVEDVSGWKFSAEGVGYLAEGNIGGWNINATTIYSDGNNIILDSANKKIESGNYVSGSAGAGFHISEDLFETANFSARGLIRTAVFQKDVISSVGGNLMVLDSDVLDADMTALDNSTLTTKATTTFAVGDILRIKDGTDDEWFEVTAVAGAVYTCTRDKKGDYEGILVDSYSESNASGYSVVRAGHITQLGQSFIAIAGTLDSCKFELKKSGSPTGNITAKLYAHTGTFGTDGKPTGSVLATSDNFDIATLTTTEQLITFSFTGADRVNLTAGTHYCIEVEYTGGDSSNYLRVGNDSSSPTHSGNASFYDSSWQTTANDVCFYVYADINPTWKKGATIVNYGQSGDGGVYMTASESNAPYLSVFTHAGSPWTDLTTRLRLGNLNGYLGYSTDLYGIGIGETDDSLTYDPTNGLRITGTITAGVVKTDVAGNARVELTKTSNRLSVYNSSDVLLGYLGNAGSGDFLYINYLSGESGNPVEINNANGSETLKINDTHATKAINAVLIQSASENASTMYLSNSANYRTLTVVGSSGSYPAQQVQNSGNNITLYAINTGANRAILASSNSNAGVNTTGCAIQAHQSGTSSIYGTNVAGCYCSKAGVWTDTSSKIMKENFEDIKVLDIIKNLDVKKYNYISEKRQTKKQIKKYLEDTKQIKKYFMDIGQKKSKIDNEYAQELKRPVPKHISPMAEDFYKAFGVGDDKGISPKDLAGVALQAIKELTEKVERLEKK